MSDPHTPRFLMLTHLLGLVLKELLSRGFSGFTTFRRDLKAMYVEGNEEVRWGLCEDLLRNYWMTTIEGE